MVQIDGKVHIIMWCTGRAGFINKETVCNVTVQHLNSIASSVTVEALCRGCNE